jgi:hypothetical protein
LTSSAAVFFVGPHLMSLRPVDLAIIVLYFVNSGEEFLMAGREMTAWIAGLSFISANLGSLEMMGYAAATYQYGILVGPRVLAGCHSGHYFPFFGDAAVLLGLQDALGSRLPEATVWRGSTVRIGNLVCSDDHPDERHQHVLIEQHLVEGAPLLPEKFPDNCRAQHLALAFSWNVDRPVECRNTMIFGILDHFPQQIFSRLQFESIPDTHAAGLHVFQL